jgi:hypothetical protein
MSDKPLFQDADETERRYAPDQLPDDERTVADESSGMRPPDTSRDDAPAAVPLSGNIAATPPAETFEPGMRREAADIASGEPVVGRDDRDSAVKPAGSVTQARDSSIDKDARRES